MKERESSDRSVGKVLEGRHWLNGKVMNTIARESAVDSCDDSRRGEDCKSSCRKLVFVQCSRQKKRKLQLSVVQLHFPFWFLVLNAERQQHSCHHSSSRHPLSVSSSLIQFLSSLDYQKVNFLVSRIPVVLLKSEVEFCNACITFQYDIPQTVM